MPSEHPQRSESMPEMVFDPFGWCLHHFRWDLIPQALKSTELAPAKPMMWNGLWIKDFQNTSVVTGSTHTCQNFWPIWKILSELRDLVITTLDDAWESFSILAISGEIRLPYILAREGEEPPQTKPLSGKSEMHFSTRKSLFRKS